LIAGNDPDAIMLPALRVIVIVGMIGMGVVVKACHRAAFR
jgi:hypothetical protein